MELEPPPKYVPRSHSNISNNHETASIRSLAPSYHSATPSYHSTVPVTGPPASPSPSSIPRSSRSGSGIINQHNNPSLDNFRIPTWSNATTQNPTARHYQRVAHRRTIRGASANNSHHMNNSNILASSSESPLCAREVNGNVNVIEEEKGIDVDGDSEGDESEEGGIRRPLEDRELVGEDAAERARKERLEREREIRRRAGDEVLRVEDERWDWMINQMRDWDQREKSWQRYKTDVEGVKK